MHIWIHFIPHVLCWSERCKKEKRKRRQKLIWASCRHVKWPYFLVTVTNVLLKKCCCFARCVAKFFLNFPYIFNVKIEVSLFIFQTKISGNLTCLILVFFPTICCVYKIWRLNQEINLERNKLTKFEPRHDKTNKMGVRPPKTQISLGIRSVWSESSQCAQWVAEDQGFLHVDSEDSDQTGRMPRLIRVRWTRSHFVCFVMSRLKWREEQAGGGWFPFPQYSQ